MYLHRSVAALKFRSPSCKSRITGTVHALRAVRWQSLVAPKRKTGALRWLTYGLGAATVGTGGIISYANRDSSFKKHLDTYVPGFGSLADYVGDGWTALYNDIFPKRTSIGMKKEEGKKGWQPGSPPAQPVRRDPGAPSTGSPAQTVQQDVPPETPKGTMEAPAQKPVEAEKGEKLSATQKVDEAATQKADEAASTQKVNEAAATQKVNKATEAEADTESKEAMPPASLGIAGGDSAGHGGGATPVGDGRREHQELPVPLSSEAVVSAAAKEISDKLQTSLDTCAMLADKLKQTNKHLFDAIDDHKKRLSGKNMGGAPEENRQGVAESEATVLQAVQAAEASLKAAEADMEVASQALREQLADARKHDGLGTLVEDFEQKVHSAVAEFQSLRGVVGHGLESGKQLVGEHREAEKSGHSGEGELSTERGDQLAIQQLSELKRRHQDELDKLSQEAEQKLASALQQQRQTLELMNEERLLEKLEEQEKHHKEDLRVKIADLQRRFEMELRDQLRIQIEAHGDHLRDALDRQAKEITAQWASNMDAKLRELETRQQLDMAKALAYLKGIESMVDTVATTGKAVREQLSLRVAFDTLYSRLYQISGYSEPHVCYSIERQVAAVKDAAAGEFFVAEVISSIPSTALTGGVQSAAGLKTRFGKVKKMCRRVALVPENGGLGAYALSLVHSLITFDTGHVDDATPPETMTTFDLLHLAEEAVNGDDLDAAVRYMNQLGGEPRRVAQDWMSDARLYLETMQAANLIATYLSTSGKPVEQ